MPGTFFLVQTGDAVRAIPASGHKAVMRQGWKFGARWYVVGQFRTEAELTTIPDHVMFRCYSLARAELLAAALNINEQALCSDDWRKN